MAKMAGERCKWESLKTGGSVEVYGKDGGGAAQMKIDENGGTLLVSGKDGEGNGGNENH